MIVIEFFVDLLGEGYGVRWIWFKGNDSMWYFYGIKLVE